MRMLTYMAATIAGIFMLAYGAAGAQKTFEFAAYTFPPYSFKNQHGGYGGADLEITEAVFKRLGYTIKWIDILIVDRAVGMKIIKENTPQFDRVDEVPEVSVDKAPVPFSLELSRKYWADRGTGGRDLMRAYEEELDAFVKEGKKNEAFTNYVMSCRLDADNHIILE